MSAAAAPVHCALRLALGEHEACTGSSCELWFESGCVLEGVEHELRSSPSLARHLLDLRAALDKAATADEASRVRSLFHRRLNEEQAAET